MVEEVKKIKSDEGTITTIKTIRTVKKAPSKKISSTKISSTTPTKLTAKQREELLIENFVGLQKVMINLSIKFEGLSENISRLLEVFELSARDQLGASPKTEDKELLKKIDNLIDQNKTIAKGLVLIEEKVRERKDSYASQGSSYQPSTVNFSASKTKPLPRI